MTEDLFTFAATGGADGRAHVENINLSPEPFNVR